VLLAVDASVLVAELPRARGRRILDDPGLDFVVSEHTWSEVTHELPIRLAARERLGHLPGSNAEQMLRECLVLASLHIDVVPATIYEHLDPVARKRVPRDPNDWPTVALALTLECGIWTADADFLGCGVPTWTTETLHLHLHP
jgi:predicted nucleic acid-binding protein